MAKAKKPTKKINAGFFVKEGSGYLYLDEGKTKKITARQRLQLIERDKNGKIKKSRLTISERSAVKIKVEEPANPYSYKQLAKMSREQRKGVAQRFNFQLSKDKRRSR